MQVDCIQRLVLSACGGDDFIGSGAPDERFGLLVVVDEDAVDGDLEIDGTLEDVPLGAPFGDTAKSADDAPATGSP
jgi:hypothetical protein